MKKQKQVVKELREMFNNSSIFEIEFLTKILMVKYRLLSYNNILDVYMKKKKKYIYMSVSQDEITISTYLFA